MWRIKERATLGVERALAFLVHGLDVELSDFSSSSWARDRTSARVTESYELLAPLLDSSPHIRKGLSQMACGEYQHVHGVDGVRPFLFWVEIHASFPRLADRQTGVFPNAV